MIVRNNSFCHHDHGNQQIFWTSPIFTIMIVNSIQKDTIMIMDTGLAVFLYISTLNFYKYSIFIENFQETCEI